MGTVFKPIVTRPLPKGAEITERNGERVARWRSAGKVCSAPVRTTPSGDRIVVEIKKYFARFRDGSGVTRTVATGCRDRMAARAVLADLERRAEMVHAGVITPAQDAISEHKRESIETHIDAYAASLKAKGRTPHHCTNVRRHVMAVVTACKFKSLQDVRRDAVEKWVASSANANRSARTINSFVDSMVWFCNFCVSSELLAANPLARIARLDTRLDRRRQPRAFTEAELVRLLDAARRRPLVEALRFNRGWRKGKAGARLRPVTRAKLERLGMERALIYKTLFLTGLRVGELRAIRVCDVIFDDAHPHILLDARHEKNREGSTIPLRPDLAENLRRWIGERRDGPLLDVSASLIKLMNRDLEFAGIAKRDERNRTACLHGLRHSFCSLLSRGGVAPRVAQAAMRHSSIDLTMNIYTDPKLIDVASALHALPALPLVVDEPAPPASVASYKAL